MLFSKSLIYVLTAIITLLVISVACGSTETTSVSVQATETVTEPEPEPESVNEDAVDENVAEEEVADEAIDSGMRTFVIVPEESRASYLANEEFFEDALSKYGISAGKNDVTGSTQVIEGQLQLNPSDMTGILGDNSFKVDMI